MPVTTITPADAIDKYKGLFPEVEGMLLDNSGLYKRGLDDLKAQYEEFNITGQDKAKYTAQYIITANMSLIASSQKITLDLLTAAYSLESDVELKKAQIELVEAQKELAEAQKELVEAQKANVEEDTKYKTKQLEVLAFSNILNALIKVFQSLSEMQGSMGAGKLTIPARMMAIMRETIIACLRLIDADGTYGTVFDREVGGDTPEGSDTPNPKYNNIIDYLESGLSYKPLDETKDDAVGSKS